MKFNAGWLCFRMSFLLLNISSVHGIGQVWSTIIVFLCSIPFLPICRSADNLRTVYIDFYRTYEERSALGGLHTWRHYAISRSRVHQQLWELNNFWYKDRVTFRLGSIRDYDYPGMFRVTKPFNTTPCEHLLVNATTGGVFDPSRISAVYSESYDYGEEGFFGCASRVFSPLGGKFDGAPFVSLANSRVYQNTPIMIDGNTFATTLAHEIGHLLGFDHTLSRQQNSFVQHFEFCGLDIKYPAFLSGQDSFAVRDEKGIFTVYNHDEWNGRLNIMSGGIPPDSIFPFNWGLLGHSAYGAVFDKIMECWFEMSSMP